MNIYIGQNPLGLKPGEARSTETSSLERFVRAKGLLFAGGNYGKRAVAIQLSVGAALAAAGGIVLTLPLFGVDWHVMFGSIGPLTAGITNLAVGLVIRKRISGARSTNVTLTPEARSVITKLNRKYLGRSGSWGWEEQTARDMWVSGYSRRGWPYVADSMKLSDAVLEELEKAAFQYNRLTALLMGSAGHPALQRIAAKAAEACDQAMADILHQVGWLNRYPEGGQASHQRVEGQIREMSELGDRVQSLAASEPTFTERLAARSGMHDLLDELRMEQEARSELVQKNEG